MTPRILLVAVLPQESLFRKSRSTTAPSAAGLLLHRLSSIQIHKAVSLQQRTSLLIFQRVQSHLGLAERQCLSPQSAGTVMNAFEARARAYVHLQMLAYISLIAFDVSYTQCLTAVPCRHVTSNTSMMSQANTDSTSHNLLYLALADSFEMTPIHAVKQQPELSCLKTLVTADIACDTITKLSRLLLNTLTDMCVQHSEEKHREELCFVLQGIIFALCTFP